METLFLNSLSFNDFAANRDSLTNDPINQIDPSGLFGQPDSGGGGSNAGGIVGIILAVLGALRVIFGGQAKAQTRMVGQVNQRFASNETGGSRRAWKRASILAGVGAVSRYIGGDDEEDGYKIDENGEYVYVIHTRDPNIGPRIGPAPMENSSWLRLFRDWLTGTGKQNRIFGPNSSMSIGMRTSPEIDYQRAQYCKLGQPQGYKSNPDDRRFGLYGWGLPSKVPYRYGTIGIGNTKSADGALRALSSGSRTFAGTFTLTISNTAQGAIFEVYNETSIMSLGAGIGGSVSRGGSILNLPGSTITQTIWWRETNPCGK